MRASRLPPSGELVVRHPFSTCASGRAGIMPEGQWLSLAAYGVPPVLVGQGGTTVALSGADVDVGWQVVATGVFGVAHTGASVVK